MNTNVILRIVGFFGAIAILCVAAHLPLLVFVLTFLALFSVHFGADLEGDLFFTDEPLGVAVTRYAGYIAAWGFGSAALYAHLPLRFYVLGLTGSLFTHFVGDAFSVKKEIMAFNLQSLLDKITGRSVRFVGLVLAIVAAALLHTHASIGVLIALTLAALNWNFPILRKSSTFSNFADPKYWPTFVLLGTAIMFVVPGWQAKLLVGAILAIFDGMYFTDNPGNY